MMEKITDQNLERYDSRLKEWCDRKFFEKGNYGKYQTTEEASAVAFYPVPNTSLKGKVKFSFKETMPAEGTKGPDNPSTITGVSSIDVTHGCKNYVSLPYHTPNRTLFDVGWTINDDKSVTAVGLASANSAFYFTGNGTTNLRLVPNRKYFLHGCPSGGSLSTYYIAAVCGTDSTYSNAYDVGNGAVFIPKTHNNNINIGAIITKGYSANVTFRAQLEDGETGTSYDLVQRAVSTINLGDTYYGGEIDLATGIMIVSRFGIILDSSIPLLANGAYGYAHNNINGVISNRRIAFRLNGDDQGFPRIQEYNYNSDDVISISHFKRGSHLNSYDTHPIFIIQELPGHWLVFRDDKGWLFSDSRTSSENYLAFLNWLDAEKEAGTPVVLTYKLEDPFTVQLTPQQILSLPQLNKYTPRLNTVYTDADSIQISYLKSPIRDEYEKTQAILSLGGNS